MPPAPKAYFNDYAGVVNRGTALKLNGELEQFERDTSNQIVVAVFPKMQSDSSIEDYTVRIARAWHVGQKGRNNGAVLFVFVQDHKMFIQVGYGLEGALTDYQCKQIIENEIKPRFRAGDFTGGLAAGVHAMIAATKGEYKGTGSTVQQRQRQQPQANRNGNGGSWWVAIFFFGVFWLLIRGLAKAFAGGGRGPRAYTGSGPVFFGGSDFGGGGGSDSGGGGGGGGGGDSGGFSGGGGDFGGGGAGGSW